MRPMSAKMLQIPIFHVNGEDPEAVAQVVRLAMDFRYEFKRDVVINMYGYRRLGHNEGDEPAFTQPVLYRAIAKRKSVREGYLEHLLKLGGVTREEADAIAATPARTAREGAFGIAIGKAAASPEQLRGIWADYKGGPEPACRRGRDGRSAGEAGRLAGGASPGARRIFIRIPRSRGCCRRASKWRAAQQPLDWSAAESLAFAQPGLRGLSRSA